MWKIVVSSLLFMSLCRPVRLAPSPQLLATEVTANRDKYLKDNRNNGAVLPDIHNAMECGLRCIYDNGCKSFFYHATMKKCALESVSSYTSDQLKEILGTKFYSATRTCSAGYSYDSATNTCIN